MFDSPFCKRSFTPFPLSFDPWGTLEGAGVLVLVALLGSLVIYRIAQRLRRKRMSLRRRLTLAAMTLVLLLGLSAAEQGLTLFLPADAGEPIEAIVLLGRGPVFSLPRVELSAAFWRAKRAPIIFASGSWDAPRMLEALRSQGIPALALEGENCSQTTPENAVFSAAVLQAQGIRRILLITDPPHLWRSMLDFQDEGFTVVPRFSPLPDSLIGWDRGFLVFREYLFLVTSSLERLVYGRHTYKLDSPELASLVQAARQYGDQHRKQN